MIFNGVLYKRNKIKKRISDNKYLSIQEKDGLYDVTCISDTGNVFVNRAKYFNLLEEDEVLDLLWDLRIEEARNSIRIKERFKIYSKWFSGFKLDIDDYIYNGFYMWQKTIGDYFIVINTLRDNSSIMYENKEISFFDVDIHYHDKDNNSNSCSYYYRCVNYYIVREIIRNIKRGELC